LRKEKLNTREEGSVLVVWFVVHGVDGGEVYIAGENEMDGQHPS
jgi:hypothetical protein